MTTFTTVMLTVYVVNIDMFQLNGNTDIFVCLNLGDNTTLLLYENISGEKNISNINIDCRYYVIIWKNPHWGFPPSKKISCYCKQGSVVHGFNI
jgi:hypothetical protein